MELDEIEDKICRNEMTAAQVFTQMKQHVGNRNDILDEAVRAIRSCELVAPNVFRIRSDEAVGALMGLKSR